MHKSVFGQFLVRAFVLCFALLFRLSVANAVPTGGGGHVLDCGDSSNSICLECCLPACCNVIFCDHTKQACCLNKIEDCGIINKPGNKAAFADVSLVMSAGATAVKFEREYHRDGAKQFFAIMLEEVVHPKAFQKRASFHVKLTGDDAAVASLLYPLAWLQMGDSALDALHGLGYEVSFMGAMPPSKTCQMQFTDEFCMALATQLSQGIDASIAIGAKDERDAFNQGVQMLGAGFCSIIP